MQKNLNRNTFVKLDFDITAILVLPRMSGSHKIILKTYKLLLARKYKSLFVKPMEYFVFYVHLNINRIDDNGMLPC